MNWIFKPKPTKEAIDYLSKEINTNSIISTLLVQRNIHNFEEAKAYFRPKLEDLHDPYLMKDMEKAVNRIELAIQNNENILVFGDYDVDGTTAVSLVSTYLKTIHPNIDTYIPDRYLEGYGVSYKAIDYAEDNEISLIIALDCGIKSTDHVNYASAKNIDFIICDHHRPGPDLPKAIAVLDPKRSDCNYPYDELCGCGVGFKLIQALGQNRNQTINDLKIYLDLVATAIAADIVPITGENRILAKFGLQQINTNPRSGIKAMIQGIKKPTLEITDVVFGVAPKINAAGRIKHGNYAVQLLSEFNLEQATAFAKEIEQYNTDRKLLDQKITKEALQQIIENDETDRFTNVVYQEDWHKGVIGIVASRIIEKYYKPTLVFTKSGEKLAASARSVKNFDVYNALESCSEHLEQFGGHMYAAGLTLKEENYISFKNAFEEIVKKTIHQESLSPELTIDHEINFDEITPKLISLLKQFEPFGPQNMTPLFYTKNVVDTGYGKTMGANDEHLRLFIKHNGISFPAIGFGLGSKINLVKNRKPLDIVYSIEENHFNGEVSIQLTLRDIKESKL